MYFFAFFEKLAHISGFSHRTQKSGSFWAGPQSVDIYRAPTVFSLFLWLIYLKSFANFASWFSEVLKNCTRWSMRAGIPLFFKMKYIEKLGIDFAGGLHFQRFSSCFHFGHYSFFYNVLVKSYGISRIFAGSQQNLHSLSKQISAK